MWEDAQNCLSLSLSLSLSDNSKYINEESSKVALLIHVNHSFRYEIWLSMSWDDFIKGYMC
jgi:hypothetical protein